MREIATFFKLFSTAHAAIITGLSFSLIGRGGLKDDNIFPLLDRAVGIGTDPNTCAIIYPAGTANISAFHCQIVPQNGGWFITDFSDAGTWLNGTKMVKFQAYPLNVGDVFYLASLENSFCLQINAVPSGNEQPNVNQPSGGNQPLNPIGGQNPSSSQWNWRTIKEKFFTTKGRLSRMPYVIRVLSLGFIYMVLAFGLLELDKIPSDDLGSGMTVLICLILAVLLLSSIAGYMLAIRRLHDLNHSGWWALTLLVVPIVAALVKLDALNLVSFAFGLYLMIKKGTVGQNRFGSDPLQ